MFNLHFLSHIGIILLIISMLAKPLNERYIRCLTSSLWCGSLAIGILSLFFHGSYYDKFQARQVLVLFGSYQDPNNQAAFLLIGVSIALYYIVSEKKYLILSFFTILVNMISIIMTGSRGGFVSAAVLFMIIVLFMSDNQKTRIWALIVMLMVGFVIIMYSDYFINSESWNRIFIAEGYQDGSGRIERWSNVLNLLNENPLYYVFGAGWGADWGYQGIESGVHNTYLSILCDTGIIGIILFHYPIIKCCSYLWKENKYLPLVVAISCLLPAFFLDSINKRFFWNSLLFLFINYIYVINNSTN